MMESTGKLSRKRLAGLAAAMVFLWFVWDTPVVYPIRIFVTFLHEISHGVAGVLTGGSVEKITVEPNGSGLCFVRGGWRIAVLPAGYLGSMLSGCLILILTCRTRLDKIISLVLGGGLILVTLFYVRSFFGFWMGLVLGAALAASGRWLPEDVNDSVLTLIGMASCLYAVFDIRTLFKIGVSVPNDAVMFSREILPLPPAVWAVVWGVAALVCLAAALKVALEEKRT
mgnify:CR=1 FL=1